MCGICGIVGFSDKNLLKKMCKVVNHRGPDDSGIFIDKNICLGVRRLSVIDIKSGHQPIHNENESIWIIHNGEIYNFLELREYLERMGHGFYTNSDTEVIVHLYEELGDACVKILRGMFAFAIWDSNEKRLLLARDRFGEKPLYYTIVDGSFLFGSEIKSILEYEKIPRKVDIYALNLYLSLRYVPGPWTMFKGIKKLLPANIITYKNGKVSMKRYWKPRKLNFSWKSEKFYIEKLYDLLKDSVRMRLVSDVPLGVYLSGGLDSSTITSLMSKFSDEPIKTFSVGYGQTEDELAYANFVANYFGTDHHEFIVRPKDIDLIPKMIWYMDEPLADDTVIPTFIISKLAKKYVTVALTGEGGDELFSGYLHEKAMLLANSHQKLLRYLNKLKILNFLKLLPYRTLDHFFEYPSSMGQEGKKRLIEFLTSQNIVKRYSILISNFSENEKKILYSDRLLFNISKSSSIEKLFYPFFKNNNNLSNQMLSVDLKMWLPDYILLRLDKMTMANSIEGRTPLLDYKLADLSLSIPVNLKLRGFTEKYILRKVAAKLLPKKIQKRKKRPFITPIHLWGERELFELCSQSLSDKDILKYFKQDYIERILKNYKKSKLIVGRQLWTLLTFAIWYKIFMENDGSFKKYRHSNWL